MSLDEMLIPPRELEKNDDLIKKKLTQYLSSGALSLALGAGVSKNFNLPSWHELVQNISEEYYGESSIDNDSTPSDLEQKIDEIRRDINDKTEYINLIKDVLYKDVNYVNDSSKLIKNELLISIGSLLMGSQRGSIDNVITFNFDDILEWYLELHGYDVQVISNPRSVTTNSDVITYHPNGFLPLSEDRKSTSNIIFGETSFFMREKEANIEDEMWKNILNRIFIENIFIFIGLSGEDRTINSRLLDIYENKLNKKRVIGFWFFLPDDNMNESKKKRFLKYGIIPIVKRKKEIPKYLLDISRYGTNNTIK